MKKPFLNVMAAVSLLCNGMAALADNELVVNVYKNGKSAAGISVRLDGNQQKEFDKTGAAQFDLSSGAHSIQILENEIPVHSFRFNSAIGHFADINVSLVDGSKPKVSVDTYFKNETAAQRAKANKGVIAGKITENGSPISNAKIEVVGTGLTAISDESGSYKIEMPRGIYELTITHPDFGSKEIDELRVVGGLTIGSNFFLNRSNNSVEEVVVKAKINTSAFQESERYSVNVVETLGIEQLARFGDTNVAAAVIRVPSVTIQDSRHVFIRGLGGRYITTTLNGATLPSTDPAKRTVPLDLFPSNIVSQLDIKKTFISSMPGESTGGNLVINTRTFPNEETGKISFTTGYVSGVTGKDSLTDPHSGDWDIFGWDDGTREEDIRVTAIAKALEFTDYLSASAEADLRKTAALLLSDDLDLATETADPNVSFGVSYGDVYALDSLESDLGFFTALNYKNSWERKDSGVSRTYSVDGVNIRDNFVFDEYSNNTDVSGLISLGLTRGDSTYQSNTILSRVTESRVENYNGLDGDAQLQSIRYSIDWEERQFVSQQFTGEHFLDEDGNFTADWQVTVSQARRLAPDRREVRFDLEGNDGVYNLVVPNVLRRFEDLNDDNVDFSTNFKYMLDASGDSESSVSMGIQAITRKRDSDSKTYGFTGGLLTVDDNAPNLHVSDVINAGNITGDPSTGLSFLEKTLASDSYEADMELNSIYVGYDTLFLSEYQIIAGIRYEDYEQTTKTFKLQGDGGPALTPPLDEDIILPSISFNWYFQEDQQLRFAITKTVARPDFKETSNATFYDTNIRKRIQGNPNLGTSEIVNFDVRWEKYWSDDESVSLAFFYKDMEDPIERVELVASGTASDSRTFQNSKSAEIYGVEFDSKKTFALNPSLTKSIFVALNASYVDSEAVDITKNKKRRLQGQAEYTVNLILGYDDIENNQELTLLINQNGDSVRDVGIFSRPDIIEESRLDVKVNYKYYWNDDFVFKVKISNLLDSETQYTQGGNVLESYKNGVAFEAGIDWNF